MSNHYNFCIAGGIMKFFKASILLVSCLILVCTYAFANETIDSGSCDNSEKKEIMTTHEDNQDLHQNNSDEMLLAASYKFYALKYMHRKCNTKWCRQHCPATIVGRAYTWDLSTRKRPAKKRALCYQAWRDAQIKGQHIKNSQVCKYFLYSDKIENCRFLVHKCDYCG